MIFFKIENQEIPLKIRIETNKKNNVTLYQVAKSSGQESVEFGDSFYLNYFRDPEEELFEIEGFILLPDFSDLHISIQVDIEGLLIQNARDHALILPMIICIVLLFHTLLPHYRMAQFFQKKKKESSVDLKLILFFFKKAFNVIMVFVCWLITHKSVLSAFHVQAPSIPHFSLYLVLCVGIIYFFSFVAWFLKHFFQLLHFPRVGFYLLNVAFFFIPFIFKELTYENTFPLILLSLLLISHQNVSELVKMKFFVVSRLIYHFLSDSISECGIDGISLPLLVDSLSPRRHSKARSRPCFFLSS